ncbi:hypothetical protein Ndes2437B_g08443 [Nannochloris sp. 'desiccata']
MAVQNQPAGLHAPEGLFSYFCERLPSLLSFSAEHCSRIVLAEVKNGPAAGPYVLWNVHTALFIYNSGLNERDPLRKIELRQPHQTTGAGSTASASPLPSGYITSISFTPDSADEYDLLVGMSNGEVKALSLTAQFAAGPTNSRPISSVVFNAQGNLTPSRCVSVSWLPGSTGSFLTSVHADGSVYLHQKIIGNSSDTLLLERTSNDSALRPAASAQLLHRAAVDGIAASAVSPSGKHIALACRDDTQDGKLIAAGGEDDLVAVYNFEKRQLVAHLQGHTSWVSGVAFDPWAPSLDVETSSPSSLEKGRYRLASVGQDCQGMLWEVGAGLLESNSGGGGGGLNSINSGGVGRTSDGMDIDGEGVRGNSPYGGGGGGGNNVIAPALPRTEMTFLEPLSQLKMHIEPLCDVVFEPNAMLVSSNDGSVKKFIRPLIAGAEETSAVPVG